MRSLGFGVVPEALVALSERSRGDPVQGLSAPQDGPGLPRWLRPQLHVGFSSQR